MNISEKPKRAGKRTGRTEVYAVRVRESFKGDILALQAELQLARHRNNAKAKRVTEGEVLELMLAALQAFRRNSDAIANAVPLANDVWEGVHKIAQQMQCSSAEVVEHLVVQRISDLGLLPRRQD